ncbi:MAG: hypothetical protein Q8L35_04750 [Actinomycetota bacterium]|nr:hypothetical protein [Actinomycetota bacterium]
MLDYLDADLRNFINQYVTSFLAWDIIVFFHKNPSAIGAANELAGRLGRRAEDIEQAAQELVGKAVLTCDDTIFMYTPSDDTRLLVDRFVQAINIREKRLLILTEVLKRR